ALQIDRRDRRARGIDRSCEPRRARDRRRPPHVRREEVAELTTEGLAPRDRARGVRELVERRNERLGDEAPAEAPEIPRGSVHAAHPSPELGAPLPLPGE